MLYSIRTQSTDYDVAGGGVKHYATTTYYEVKRTDIKSKRNRLLTEEASTWSPNLSDYDL